MDDMNREDFGRLLKEVFRAVFIGILIFAAMVIYIFQSSAYAWEKKLENQEIEAQRRLLDQQIAKASIVGVYAWVNHWVDPISQARTADKLEPNVEYIVGPLLMYDRNYLEHDLTAEQYDELKHIYSFTRYMIDHEDDPYYADPIFTFSYSGYVHVRYSIDSSDGWLICAPTARGLKTNNYQYIPSENIAEPGCSGCGQGMTSVIVPANGRNGLEVNIDNAEISEEMRPYNYCISERLGDVYKNIPEELSDRTRKIYTSHLIVEAYKEDPRVAGANRRPVVTFMIRIRSYGEWDLKKEEYDQAVFSVPDLTSEEYSPKITVELVI